jgi:RNA polymerase sigma-70 factor, ECF subfamily
MRSTRCSRARYGRRPRKRLACSRPHVDVAEVELATAAPAPDAGLDRAVIAGCMAKLGEVHRSVVTLRVLEELTGDEAARELGLTAGHVAVLLHRARQQLEGCITAPRSRRPRAARDRSSRR